MAFTLDNENPYAENMHNRIYLSCPSLKHSYELTYPGPEDVSNEDYNLVERATLALLGSPI
eukprot:7016203-Prorocentrum_lima.AAC.1